MHGPLDARSTVTALNQAWEADDLDGVIALLHETCVFHVHVSEELVDHAGASVGRAAIRAALTAARSNFDYVLYRPIILSATGTEVRQRVEFMGSHKASGAQMSMRFRQVYQVEQGLVTRCDEYHDAPMVEAFFRLVGNEQTKSN
jgi:ketosteroid isomerase-like protein